MRNVKKGMYLLEQSYEECIKAQSVVTSMEKTSADEDTNWNWVKVHLRKPFKEVMEKAEILLENKGEIVNQETEEKEEAAIRKRKAKNELSSLEAGLKDLVEGLEEVVESTTIWVKENHAAMVETVNSTQSDLNQKHLEVGEDYLKYLDVSLVEEENTRQQTFRESLSPKLGNLKAKLLSKTPAGGGGATGPVSARQPDQVYQ